MLDKPEAAGAAEHCRFDAGAPGHACVHSPLSLGMTNTQMLETGKLALAVEGSWALDWMKNIEGTLGTGVLPG